jgi:tetratricopeptide (TPR) repeat protein
MSARGAVRTIQALVAALVVLVAAGSGRADDSRGNARAHYARGLELGAQSGYEGALREFNEAYAISPHFEVLYNIGQAHIALGHVAEAIEVLSRYLRDGGDKVTEARRAQVQGQIAVLQSKLPKSDPTPKSEEAQSTATAPGAGMFGAVVATAEPDESSSARPGTLSVRCPEPGLKLLLDGKRVDPTALVHGVAVSAGTHNLALAAPGRRAAEQGIEVPAGAVAIVICQNLLPAAAPARPPVSLDGPPVFSEVSGDAGPRPGTQTPPGTLTPTVHVSTVGYVLGGLGVAFGGTAIGVYLWNRGRYQDAQAEQAYLNNINNRGAPDFFDRAVQYNDGVDSIHQVNAFAVGLAFVSAGLIAGGISLVRYDRKRGEKTGQLAGRRSWAALSPGGVSWMGVW